MASEIAPGETLISLRGVTKIFGEGATAFAALKGVDIDITRGDAGAVEQDLIRVMAFGGEVIGEVNTRYFRTQDREPRPSSRAQLNRGRAATGLRGPFQSGRGHARRSGNCQKQSCDC